MNAALLLLADSRFPTGAHAHSAGVEASHRRGHLDDVADLEAFLEGRLATTAPTEAAFAAASCAGLESSSALDVELTARIPSPKLRAISRSLGRQMLRPAERAWPSPHYRLVRQVHADGPLQPIALGIVARCARLQPTEAALCLLHQMVGSVTTAAVRLLGLDPFEVHALAARFGSRLEQLALTAGAQALLPASRLPSTNSLLADILAEHHATWEVRLFAS